MVKQTMYLAFGVGIMIVVVGIVFGNANQQNNVEGLELAPAAKQGSYSLPSGLGPELNKEKWHEDPFADEAAAVRAAYTGDK